MIFDVLVAGYLRQNGWRSLISACAVAFGVAIACSIGTIAATTNALLASTIAALDPRVNLLISGPATGFDQRLLIRVRAIPLIADAEPIVDGTLMLPAQPKAGDPGETLSVHGVDLLHRLPGDEEFRAELPGPYAPIGSTPGPQALLADGAAIVSAQLAAGRNLRTGSTLRASADGRAVTLHVAAVLPKPSTAFDSRTVFVDIGSAQVWFGLRGRLHRIECIVDPNRVADAGRRIASIMLPGVRVTLPAAALATPRRIAAALRFDFFALSLLSLLLGALLVYNAVGISAAQRAAEIGTLRTLGTKRGAIFRTFLTEGALIGVVGAFEGVALSTFAGYLLRSGPLAHDLGGMAAAAAAGIAFAAGSAIAPGLAAAAIPPALAMRSRHSERFLPSFGLSAAIAASARLLRRAARRVSPAARLDVMHLGATPRRTAVAVAALSVAIATVVCIAIVTGSHRAMLIGWSAAHTSGQMQVATIALFEKTFAAANALAALTLCVAILGVASTFSALAAELEHGLSILRRLGLRRSSAARMLLAEAAFIAAWGCVLGTVLGAGLALALRA